jgi:hypothetical protein
MEPSRQPPCGRTEAYQHTMISRVPFPNCRSGVIGLTIAGNPKMTGTCRPGKRRSGIRSSRTHTKRVRERGNEWSHARALRDAVSGGRAEVPQFRAAGLNLVIAAIVSATPPTSPMPLPISVRLTNRCPLRITAAGSSRPQSTRSVQRKRRPTSRVDSIRARRGGTGSK